ncbi:hypothetical protein [Parabacteroides bouchesdurhonensis]|uniref:hypothetical protein n=1 Tax=Parabacteroides bouchesdurhonensis TaxID=1936995 RepID=UPI000C854AD1|nr:hypothetical protein [Parabacteroides bouchesdurhonensis]
MKYFTFITCFFLLSCIQKENKKLNYALDFAENNRGELEVVLRHYKRDSQKLTAAKFLIKNMPGHAGYDSTYINKWQPIYDQLCAISEKYNWERTGLWARETRAFGEKLEINIFPSPMRQDILTVKADWLIGVIDLAFKAWQENEYTKNSSFEDFCSYILPYRFQNGVCLDNARQVFYQRHAGYFSDNTKNVQEVVDSLSNQYSFLQYNFNAATAVPIYDVATFEYVKRGLCEQMTWYNCLLFSALGMAVAIDFVPEWGNRNESHSWNALIVDGNSYPFEPFWDKDRWKYKRIYNNECFDLVWGKFRLPKVYRNTYEYHFTGPAVDKQVSPNDIPDLFKNLRKKDVSSEYFQTTDVSLEITERIPDKTPYCYLCVYSSSGWIPVQWGKIEKDKHVTFKDMGRDIAYLPAFFKNGTVIPAAPLFILKQDGSIEKQLCTSSKTDITIRTPKHYLYKNLIADGKKPLNGGRFTGSNDPEATEHQSENLFTLTDSIDMWTNDIKISGREPYRYIKFLTPSDTISLCEVSFFERQNGQLIEISNVKVSANAKGFKEEETLDMLTDHISATGFKGTFQNKKEMNRGILFDLGKPCLVEQISYIPYTKSEVVDSSDFSLFYWDNEWKHVETIKGNNNFITFKQVPQNTMYKVTSQKIKERIFTYDRGMIKWY